MSAQKTADAQRAKGLAEAERMRASYEKHTRELIQLTLTHLPDTPARLTALNGLAFGYECAELSAQIISMAMREQGEKSDMLKRLGG